MAWTFPSPQHRGISQWGIQTIEMPEETTGATGDDGAIGRARLLTAVADDCAALGVAETEEIRDGILVVLLLFGNLG